MKNKSFRLFPSTIAASFILFTPALHADAITWDAGGGVDNNWSTLLNWSDDADVTGDDVTFNAAGAISSGTTNNLSASATINTLSYSFEDTDNQHTTAIGDGQTLAVTGDFLLASGASATAATKVTLNGSTGTLTVGGTSFQVGQTTPTAGTNTNSLDMSGLGTFTANLGSGGTFRMGSSTVDQFGALTTVKLAATSNITANLLGVGDRAGRGGLHTLKLGATANTINANTLAVGPGGSGGRGNGELSFETSTGTLQLRAADGTSAITAVNLINNSFGTANNLTATANFASHNVDAKIVTLTMARRNNSTGATAAGTATLTFDTGTLEVGTANMAVNAQASSTSGAISATMNIGGGIASFNAITMATSSGGGTSTTTALLNLTGGATTVNGDITKGGSTGAGATTATVALKGGTLDMTAGNIGDSTNPVTLTLNSGTLKNVAEINGGGIITKTTTGSLTLSGANTFTGGVTISAGELKITESGSLGTGPKTITVQNLSSLTLDGTAGNIALASNLSVRATGISILNLAGDNVINGTLTTVTGNGTATITSNGGSLNLAGNIDSAALNNRVLQLSGTSTGANTVSGSISNGTATPLNLTKSGAGTWTITNASNAYSGATTVNDGTLSLGATGTIATSASVSIKAGATLDTSGQASYSIPGTQPLTFGLDPAASGSSGKITAAALNIASAVVTISPVATLDDPVYVLATYTAGNLTGAAFGAVTGVPVGYELDYDYEGNKIALVPSTSSNFASWASSQIPPVTGGENGDDDNDGVKNLVEYALVDGGERGVFGGNTITFTKRGAPYCGDVTYIIETSETLLSGSWTDAVTQPAGDPATTISYTFTPSTPVKKFARLKVITTP